MFLSSVALISLILAGVTRRPVKKLLRLRFRYIGLLLTGAGVQALLVRPASLPALSSSFTPGLPQLGGLLYIASLALLLVFGYANRRHLGVAVIGVGLLLNTIVIAANGGQMPVDPERLAAVGSARSGAAVEGGAWSSKIVAGPDSRLLILGDWIPVPQLSGHPAILSLGDIAIAAGVVLFFLVISDDLPRRNVASVVSRSSYPVGSSH